MLHEAAGRVSGGFCFAGPARLGRFWLLRPSHLARPWVWPCPFVSHTGGLCCPMKGRGKAATETSVTRPHVFLFPFNAARKIELLCVFVLLSFFSFFFINCLLIDRWLLGPMKGAEGASVSGSSCVAPRHIFSPLNHSALSTMRQRLLKLWLEAHSSRVACLFLSFINILEKGTRFRFDSAGYVKMTWGRTGDRFF